MKLYRIYTESKPNLATLASNYLHAFTLIQAKGYWNGSSENSAIIELISDSLDDDSVVQDLARRICLVNHQQEVLITAQSVDSLTIKGLPNA